jgi:hypothetical protein
MRLLSFYLFLEARKRRHHPANTAAKISSAKYPPSSLRSSPIHKVLGHILCHMVIRMAISTPIYKKTSSLLRPPGSWVLSVSLPTSYSKPFLYEDSGFPDSSSPPALIRIALPDSFRSKSFSHNHIKTAPTCLHNPVPKPLPCQSACSGNNPLLFLTLRFGSPYCVHVIEYSSLVI